MVPTHTLIRGGLALTIAVPTFLAASAFSTAVGTYAAFQWRMAADALTTEADQTEPVERAASAKPPNAREPARIAADITRHNAFCPTCSPSTISARASSSEFTGRGDRTLGTLAAGEQLTSLPIELVATILVRDGQSLATLRHRESGIVGIYAEGDVVAPSVRVRRVERGLVHLHNGAAFEYLPLIERARSPKRNRRNKADNKRQRKRSKYELPGAKQAIDCNGPRTCRVARKFVDKLSGSPSLLRRQGRFRPLAGRGFRLSRVRKNTIPWLLALRNGDVITAINGRRLDSMDAAMAVYRDGRRASHLTVEVLRKGKPLTFEYDIR